MKQCPTCGASASEEDLFCEADGTKLAGEDPEPTPTSTTDLVDLAAYRANSSSAASGGACSACGAQGSDDGDGYCSVCGHKLDGRRTTAAPLVSGAQLGAYKIRQTAGDHATASGPDGTEVLLVVGEPEAIALEAEALERVGRFITEAANQVIGGGSAPTPPAEPPRRRPFPWIIEQERDGSSSYLALSVPSSAAQRLADVVQTQSVERALDALDALLDLASIVERVGFSFEPAPGDLLVSLDGGLLVSRLRSARRLASGERLDARRIVESLGEVFLASAILGPTSLVKLLVPNRESHARDQRHIDALRAGLKRSRDDLAAHGSPAVKERPRTHVAELCDAGLWRPYNQDSTAIAEGLTPTGEPFTILVVCDGVSSSAHSERAARVASRSAKDALYHFARSSDIGHEAAPSAVGQAIKAAHLAICADHAASPAPDPPGTTIAAALVFRRRLTVGWVGDSRAYWLTPRGAELLTHDHSWVNEAIARGEVKDADEVQGALAHTITRCLGPLEVGDAPMEVEPDVRARDLAGPGIVLLCSDGLWNYAPKATDIAAVMRAAPEEADARVVARLLINYALARGGQDNVSVALYAHLG